MLLTLAIILLIAALVYKGLLFIDFQLQVGSFIWGKRLGIKRKREGAAERLGKAFKKLDAVALPPMTDKAVQAEIDAARSERRGVDTNARFESEYRG